jgi:two-component system LytT family response regulator
MIETVIVDDEPNCCESLVTMLGRYCPEVKVIKVCHSGEEALKIITDQSPGLLFLDIEMPQMDGFELLEQLPEVNFELIFTTSYDQYAIKAFRFSALDYLLKPVDKEELRRAVQKVISRNQKPSPQQIDLLLQKLNQPLVKISKIAIPTVEGLHLLPIESIVSCTSESNYTIIKLKDGQKIVTTRILKEIQEMLEEYSFLRVHHSYIVNLNEVMKYIKGEGGHLIMSDGTSIDVSRSRKEMLLRRLLPYRG